MGADPAAFWYKGEIGFFDNYIIPLAKKLKDCNVFGASSDECLVNALRKFQCRHHLRSIFTSNYQLTLAYFFSSVPENRDE
jgi:hypothetical protein